jgi:hypothetical protein
VELYLYFPLCLQGMHRDNFTFTADCQKYGVLLECTTGFSEKYFVLRQSSRRSRSFIVLLTYPNSKEEGLGRVCIVHGIDEKHVQRTWLIWVLGGGGGGGVLNF